MSGECWRLLSTVVKSASLFFHTPTVESARFELFLAARVRENRDTDLTTLESNLQRSSLMSCHPEHLVLHRCDDSSRLQALRILWSNGVVVGFRLVGGRSMLHA